MFDIGWSELAVVACVTILVVGPKELPGLLRTIGKTVGQLRRMAGDFQKQFDEAIREAELDQVKKTMQAPFQPLEDARKAALDFQNQVNKSVNETGAEISAATAEKPPIPAGVLDPLPTPVMPQAVTAATAPAATTAIAAKPKGDVLEADTATGEAKTASRTSAAKAAAAKTGKTAAKAPARAKTEAAAVSGASTAQKPVARKSAAAKPKPGKKS